MPTYPSLEGGNLLHHHIDRRVHVPSSAATYRLQFYRTLSYKGNFFRAERPVKEEKRTRSKEREKMTASLSSSSSLALRRMTASATTAKSPTAQLPSLLRGEAHTYTHTHSLSLSSLPFHSSVLNSVGEQPCVCGSGDVKFRGVLIRYCDYLKIIIKIKRLSCAVITSSSPPCFSAPPESGGGGGRQCCCC